MSDARLRSYLWNSVISAVAVCSLSRAAVADVDIGGLWRVRYPYTLASQNGDLWLIAQNGTDLSVTRPPGTDTLYTGTIDAMTGSFTLTLVAQPPEVFLCSATIAGTVAGDSLTFSGTETYQMFWCNFHSCACYSEPVGVISGGRCGNGQLDAGEACDDSNDLSGDCCSATCQLEASGATCTTDFNVCTDDVCDGNGTCMHVNNTVPCGDACNTGQCAVGTCVLDTPRPRGTSCGSSNEPCLIRGCDGVGQCADIPRTTCRPATVRSSITLRKGFPDATGDTLSWSWKGAVGATDANDFGAPLDTTDYTLCLFSDEQLLSRTTATAGALCNGHPCWHLGSSGYRYANPRTSGIRRVRLSAPAASPPTIRVAGHGFWLLLPPSLALPELRVQLLALDAQEVGCWEAEYATPAASTPTRFHAPD